MRMMFDMKRWWVMLFMFLSVSVGIAQEKFVETVRGVVVSGDPAHELVQASIYVVGSNPAIGTVTDEQGNFAFRVPAGRQKLRIISVGFQMQEIDILVNTGKEVVLNVVLEPLLFELKGVEVVAKHDKSRPINKLTVTGARTFSTEETFRFAGSLGDPARMVRSFPGVIPANDSRNDIIIRGNSPIGVQWSLDGVEIPNLNHFNTGVGMTGGQVTMLNTNLLANSDFHMSAWPAPYGNAMAGIFDLQMRKGNNQKHEFWGQMGFNGIEAGSEGYFSKNNTSSYLVSYRYSIPDLMEKLGFYSGITPKYQDFTMKLNFDINKKNQLSVIGLYGSSGINFVTSEVGMVEFDEDLLGQYDQRIKIDAKTYILGVTHRVDFTTKTKLTTLLSLVRSDTHMPVDTMSMTQPNAEWQPLWDEKALEDKYSCYSKIEHRFSYASLIEAGVKYDLYNVNYLEKESYSDERGFFTNVDKKGSFGLWRVYTQYRQNIASRLILTGGLHGMYLDMNNTYSVEPRFGARYTPVSKHTFALAGGLYSQMIPRSFYFIRTLTPQGEIELSNKKLGFMKSAHADFSYSWSFASDWHFKAETYYQWLYNIPVKNDPNETYTILQAGGAGENVIMREGNLVNKGTGKNYGVEFTVEKFMSKNYYLLFNSTLYRSTYTNGFNKKEWSTVFDGKYLFNLASGYELTLKKGWTLFADIKGSLAGGTRYTPVLEEESKKERKVVFDITRMNELQLRNYFRTDLRIGYRRNGKKFTDELALDLQNLTNQRNIYSLIYDIDEGTYKETLLQGFVPMVTYRVNFSL
ncbi:MAG TPA: carboxypeptidase-like regulatory domain-containing protein [Prolixibacteraceae bacterium]|nr:carboxypeptidase-like regulatory domain-containing protein [Prolixibacteraceae bacterium]